MTAEAAHQARLALDDRGSNVDVVRWIIVMVMSVFIRHLSVRFQDLSNIRLLHLSVFDDSDSPLGSMYNTHLPKTKNDILGSNGGADSKSTISSCTLSYMPFVLTHMLRLFSYTS